MLAREGEKDKEKDEDFEKVIFLYFFFFFFFFFMMKSSRVESTFDHCLNTTVYLSIVADHHPFMTTVYPFSDDYFQQDNAPCHIAQIISDWFLEHDNEFTLLKWPPQSPDLNLIEYLWDVVEREIHIMDVQTTNLQQLHDALMSIWTKISEE